MAEIRRAGSDDAGPVADVYIASFRSALPSVRLAHTEDQIRVWIRERLMPETECWVATEAGRVVALLALKPGWIEQLYVAPEWHGRGIGRRLLDLAKTRGDGALELWTFQVNERARRFYERNGFEAVEHTDGSGNEEREPDVRYRWVRREPGARIAVGRTAEVFGWGDDAVLKLIRPDMPGGMADFEARVAAVVEAADLPAPRLLERVTVDGRPGLAYERVVGPSMLEVVGRRPWSTPSIARSFARLHVRTNAVPGGDLPALAMRLHDAIAASGLPGDLMSAAMALLDRLPAGDAVLHGDLHPGNVIMSPTGPAIIDWMTVTRGDPAADVARTLFLLRESVVPGASRAQLLALGLIRPWFARAYLIEYGCSSGLDAARVRAWRPAILAARLAEGIEAERPRIVAELRRTLYR
jgi:GNAT superfamily N-acetyltransferase/tRNA A-37 threonylcarbamoyl transferase component Bud32